jgi:hypothetical protein
MVSLWSGSRSCDSCRSSPPADDAVQAESITEGTLKQWSKAVGDYVKQDEEIATIETDKVSWWTL